MIFSVADIPIEVPSPLEDLVKHLPTIEPASGQLSRAQVDALMPMVDEAVARSHAVLDRFLEFDLEWRMSVHCGESEYDEAIENRIRLGLKTWADATEVPLSVMDRINPFGFCPASIETLRSRLVQVRSMLTPDDEFFEGEGLDELTAQALRDDERGMTVEFQEMGE